MSDSNKEDVLSICISLAARGMQCNEVLAEKLWSGFSAHQQATWIIVNDEAMHRFLVWLDSGFDQNEAYS